MSRERILVLDANSGAALAVLQSLGPAGYECVLGTTDDEAPALSSRWARRVARYPDPLTDAAAFKSWIASWVRENDVALIIPATECTLVPLHEMRDDPEIVKRAAIPSKEALDIFLDKERLRVLAVGLGVPAPESAYVTSISELTAERIDGWLREGAAVVKTARSKSWKGEAAHEFPTKLVSDRGELLRLVQERLPYVPVQVQQWVPGRGVGVELLADRGEIVMSLAHERLHEVPLAGGASSYRRTIPMPSELFEHARRLVGAVGYHGVAMVEYRADSLTGKHWLMEINPRFWGSLPLAIFAGADFPAALVDLLLHGAVPPPRRVRTGLCARNIRRDITWTRMMLGRRGRFSPQEQVPSLSRSLLEWTRVLRRREIWDGASIRDPRPFVRVVSHVVGGAFDKGLEKAQRTAALRMARRRSAARARRLPRRVLLLCYGNICRSAYAHARLSALTSASHEIRSAGFHAKADRPSPEDFQRVAGRHGVQLGDHRSRRVSPEDLAWAEMIVIMDWRNYKLLRQLDRRALDKVVWLGALDGGAIEIDDPYDAGDEAIEVALGRLDACLARLLEGGG